MVALFLMHLALVMKNSVLRVSWEDTLLGLMLAIMRVLALPPRESCISQQGEPLGNWQHYYGRRGRFKLTSDSYELYTSSHTIQAARAHLQQEGQPAVPVRNMSGPVDSLYRTIHAPDAALRLDQLGNDPSQSG